MEDGLDDFANQHELVDIGGFGDIAGGAEVFSNGAVAGGGRRTEDDDGHVRAARAPVPMFQDFETGAQREVDVEEKKYGEFGVTGIDSLDPVDGGSSVGQILNLQIQAVFLEGNFQEVYVAEVILNDQYRGGDGQVKRRGV